jgi:hypothetical protein
MLSKSLYTRCVNCQKFLWLYVYRKTEQVYSDAKLAGEILKTLPLSTQPDSLNTQPNLLSTQPLSTQPEKEKNLIN